MAKKTFTVLFSVMSVMGVIYVILLLLFFAIKIVY